MSRMKAKRKTAPVKILQLKLTLAHYRPPMWRTILVRDSMPLQDFARTIMTLFKMDGWHLYGFHFPFPKRMDDIKERGAFQDYPGATCARFEQDPPVGILRALQRDPTFDICQRRHTLASALRQFPCEVFSFNYDYGDNWEIKIKVTETDVKEVGAAHPYPWVLKGKGYGILEDCGGPRGLMRMRHLAEQRAAGNTPKPGDDEARWDDDCDSEAEQLLNPEAFSPDAANADLHHGWSDKKSE